MTDTELDAAARDQFDTPIDLADGDELDALVDEHDLVLVDFYTKGCTLCQAVEPVVGNVARATDAVVATLNPREDLSLVEEYDVRSVPTLLLFSEGEVVERVADGFVGTERLVDLVENHSQ